MADEPHVPPCNKWLCSSLRLSPLVLLRHHRGMKRRVHPSAHAVMLVPLCSPSCLCQDESRLIQNAGLASGSVSLKNYSTIKRFTFPVLKASWYLSSALCLCCGYILIQSDFMLLQFVGFLVVMLTLSIYLVICQHLVLNFTMKFPAQRWKSETTTTEICSSAKCFVDLTFHCTHWFAVNFRQLIVLWRFGCTLRPACLTHKLYFMT